MATRMAISADQPAFGVGVALGVVVEGVVVVGVEIPEPPQPATLTMAATTAAFRRVLIKRSPS